MNKYTVRTGQNIFDIALTLYGSIEGVFDLLISNTDGFGGKGLTMDTQLESGVVLNYHEEFMINSDIVKWLSDESVIVANGSHVYGYADIQESITSHIESFNAKLVERCCKEWPGVYENGTVLEDADINNKPQFMQAINTYYIGAGDTTLEVEAKKEVLRGPDGEKLDFKPSSTDEVSLWWEEACAVRMVVVQTGVLSSLSMRMCPKSVMVIDWGDATKPELYSYADDVIFTEHNYDGDGTHIIRVYGNFSLYSLDLTGISGVYYALAPILIDGEFKNNFPDNKTINKLFIKK